jgi:ubiquitin-protein ligase
LLTYRTLEGMDKELRSLDNAALKALYEKQFQALSDALLSGAQWQDVQDKRHLLIKIAKLIDRPNTTTPAEYPIREQ